MGETKPIFALDLSNDGIALWHRKGSSGWAALGRVPLSDPDFERRVIELRDKAPVRGRAAVVRIPRSEVLLTKVRMGVFEGDAAVSHARKQIAELTPYDLEDVCYDLGEKGFGNMAPVGVVARKTVREAESFARAHGFDPLYFTTQYSEKEFPREPRFYLQDQRASGFGLGWAVPWAAAAAIGLTAGFLGYSWLSAPSTAVTTALDRPEAAASVATEATPAPERVVETAPEPEPAPEPEQQTELAALGDARTLADALPDVAPRLPPVAADLDEITETAYPALVAGPVARLSPLDQPNQLRLANLQSDAPAVDAASALQKTLDLTITEARRDLPDVKISDEIIAVLEAEMQIGPLEDAALPAPIELAALTAPTRPVGEDLLATLPPTGESKAQITEEATALPDPPPPPVSLVTAEPGTLTPTAEGTLGPGNILIFAGPPPNPPRSRPGSEIEPPPPNPLAGFRPRLRPDGLVPADVLAAINAPPEATSELALADQPRADDSAPVDATAETAPVDATQPDTPNVAAAETLPSVGTEPAVTDPATPTAQPQADILALADPALADRRAPVRPDSLNTDVGGLLSLADPDLRRILPRNRPDDLVVPPALAPPTEPLAGDAPPASGAEDPALVADAPAAQTAAPEPDAGDALIAAADPELRRVLPRNRPDDLPVPEAFAQPEAPATPPATVATTPDQTPAVADTSDAGDALIAAADPALRRILPRNRPETLDIPAGFAPAPAPEVTRNAPVPDGDTLLALADPALADARARGRPGDLVTDIELPPPGLLALADPSLRELRTRARPTGLRIIAAPVVEEPPVQEPENGLASASRYAIAISPAPRARPGKISRVAAQVTRALQEEEDDDEGTASATTARDAPSGTVKPAPGPTSTSVAAAATEKARFSKSTISLVGVFGTPSARRALVRLPTGRYVKVKAGDRVSGWRVSAIGESSLRIQKGGRNETLRVP